MVDVGFGPCLSVIRSRTLCSMAAVIGYPVQALFGDTISMGESLSQVIDELFFV